MICHHHIKISFLISIKTIKKKIKNWQESTKHDIVFHKLNPFNNNSKYYNLFAIKNLVTMQAWAHMSLHSSVKKKKNLNPTHIRKNVKKCTFKKINHQVIVGTGALSGKIILYFYPLANKESGRSWINHIHPRNLVSMKTFLFKKNAVQTNYIKQ